MMRKSDKWSALVVVACCIVMVFHAVGGSTKERHSSAGLSGTPTAEPSEQEVTTTTVPADLGRKASAFLRNLYKVQTGDSADDRRQRLDSYLGSIMATDALGNIERKIRLDDQSTRNYETEVSVQGTPIVKQAESLPAKTDDPRRTIHVPVRVTVRDNTKHVVDRYTEQTTSTWQKDQGKWFVIEFKTGGDDS